MRAIRWLAERLIDPDWAILFCTGLLLACTIGYWILLLLIGGE
jgi:hypothetical protein